MQLTLTMDGQELAVPVQIAAQNSPRKPFYLPQLDALRFWPFLRCFCTTA